MTIAVSVVCYNNEEEVYEFAKKLGSQKCRDELVLLVTFNSGESIERLRTLLNGTAITCHVFDPKSNLGYLNGCLYGFSQFSDYENINWGIISNTDIAFQGNDAIQVLLDSGEENEAWSVGPCIIRESDGKYQNPFMTSCISASRFKLLHFVYSNIVSFKCYFALSRLKRFLLKNTVRPCAESGFVYALHGSLFALRKPLIDLLIRDSFRLFMYGEELFIAEIVRANEKRCYYCSRAKIIHKENATTSLVSSKEKQAWFKESVGYLYDRFFRDNYMS